MSLASASHRCVAAVALRSSRCTAAAAAAAVRPSLQSLLPSARASASTSACAPLSSRSFHSAPVLCGLLDKKEAQEVTDAKKKADENQKASWDAFVQIMLRDSFTLNDYENVLKAQSGEAQSDAGVVDKARSYVSKKLLKWTDQTPAQAEAAKPVLALLGALTPAEKQSASNVTPAVRTRVIASTGQTAGDVTMLLCRYDQMLAMNEWWRWRRANHMDLPTNMYMMQDYMKEDRRSGSKMPRVDKNELRTRPRKPVRR